MRRFDLQLYFSTIQKYGITETPMVPQILRTIIEQSSVARKMLKPLQLVWSAGAPLTESLQGQFYRLLKPAARVIQVWGMTEAGWISTFLWPEKDHSGSVGRLLPGMEAK
jgi:acyl-coenzyme A synthetase/AMP-(fatty) acid ligase